MISTTGGMGWLHHATKESVCFPLDSEEYSSHVESGEWHRLISDVLKQEGKLEEVATPEEEEDADTVFLNDLSDEELLDLCKEYNVKSAHNMKRETRIKKLMEIEDAK